MAAGRLQTVSRQRKTEETKLACLFARASPKNFVRIPASGSRRERFSRIPPDLSNVLPALEILLFGFTVFQGASVGILALGTHLHRSALWLPELSRQRPYRDYPNPIYEIGSTHVSVVVPVQ